MVAVLACIWSLLLQLLACADLLYNREPWMVALPGRGECAHLKKGSGPREEELPSLPWIWKRRLQHLQAVQRHRGCLQQNDMHRLLGRLCTPLAAIRHGQAGLVNRQFWTLWKPSGS